MKTIAPTNPKILMVNQEIPVKPIELPSLVKETATEPQPIAIQKNEFSSLPLKKLADSKKLMKMKTLKTNKNLESMKKRLYLFLTQ